MGRGGGRGGGGGRLAFVVAMVVMTEMTWGLGDVHTSVATVAQLVEAEHAVIFALKDYVRKEESRLETIKRYIWGWQDGRADYVHNPINSYHFLRRLTHDFDSVRRALHHEDLTQALRANITSLRGGVEAAAEADVNGAAYSLVRLQDTYNLTVDELVEGDIRGTKAVQELSADDCFRLGQQSFNNLEFDLSDKWYQKGLELMEAKQPITHEEQLRIKRIKQQQEHRILMRQLVTNMAKQSDGQMLDRFSGLGIPISFQRQIYAQHKDVAQVEQLDDYYRRLCRGEQLQPPEAFVGLKCSYVFGKGGYRWLMPLKVELRWDDPLILVYHDVLSEAETELVKRISTPRLATTMVHSFTTHQARRSLARVGKTAWVRRGDDRTTDRILQRVEDMTGLATDTSEDFHVLNYGIGGHYDAHVDFFDLDEKSLDKSPHQGDRLATVLFYLNDVEAGGSTVFPMLGVEVPARRGSALFWFNMKRSGKGDYRTLHAACPVLLGEKWIANLWIHEWGQELRWPCTRDPED
ncbi:prolyl 4-hydroxylase subunit alpha-1-like [Panulirus ornatus]|uniref:prolyl 4-hydroxylase subunit alpha-1-like n=1 Tax=Panulirus ornatus TaxID=150431 RepID=UPI003A86B052